MQAARRAAVSSCPRDDADTASTERSTASRSSESRRVADEGHHRRALWAGPVQPMKSGAGAAGATRVEPREGPRPERTEGLMYFVEARDGEAARTQTRSRRGGPAPPPTSL